MPATKPLRIAPAGRPGPSDRVLNRVAREAEAGADASEPTEPPKELPAYAYSRNVDDRKRRVGLLDDRTKALEDQRFNSEMDWDIYVAQLEALEEVGGATDEELDGVRKAERQARLRVISLDAALARLNKRKI